MRLTKAQTEKLFKENILAGLDKEQLKDKTALRVEWSYFVDMLHNNGQLSENQVNNWTLPKFLD